MCVGLLSQRGVLALPFRVVQQLRLLFQGLEELSLPLPVLEGVSLEHL